MWRAAVLKVYFIPYPVKWPAEQEHQLPYLTKIAGKVTIQENNPNDILQKIYFPILGL